MTGSLKHIINLLGADYVVEYGYKITAKARPARGPSYASGGDPAEFMEFEITSFTIRCDGPGVQPSLPIPPWLHEQIVEWLQADDDVYDKVSQDHRE